MNVPMLDLPAQFRKIQHEVMPEVQQVFDSQYFVLGPNNKKIEQQMAELAGMPFGVGTASGTDALILCYLAAGLKPGDEVITTPYTFFATASSIVRIGAKPVFVDIEEDSFNVNLDHVESLPNLRAKAFVPVHLFGLVIDPQRLLAICRRHKMWLIEDACQAVGATRDGFTAGGIGELSAFSFYPTKNLGGAGDGGMVLTRTEELATFARMDRIHGGRDRYFYDRIGTGARLDELQAAVLSVKFKYLKAWNEHRRAMAEIYNSGLKGTAVTTPTTPAGAYHIYHQYVIRAPRRDELKEYLKTKGIGSDIYYPVPLHLQNCFADMGYKQGQFPVAERTALESLALPISAELSPAQVEYVCATIREFYGGGGA
ncbi:DegT/DnrJ/EryC1/StrS family aminotransferase [candidate division KSB1 bacterium]|nr:DegT/DnrJ/EryC1/StrS family aminotransferase [candidate division KSB1 bacterium]